MSTTTMVTADELLRRSNDGQRCELIAGKLRIMTPSVWTHGRVVGNLHGLLWQHVRDNDLGLLFGAETGFLIAQNPDTVRAPDIAFVARQNVPEPMPAEGYWPNGPDLAVEVLSPSDRTGDVDDKIEAWLAAGTIAVWIVDPRLETVTIYLQKPPVIVRKSGETLEGAPVLPHFSCQVDEIFE